MTRAAGALVLVLASLVLVLASCSGEARLEDTPCPPSGTKLTYDDFGRAFLAANCQGCHGASGSDRRGAPAGFDFGTLDAVRARADRIFARAAGDNTTMPPGPDDPPAQDRAALAEWLSCGAP
jgi:mono/diheme cytochrome c family protein